VFHLGSAIVATTKIASAGPAGEHREGQIAHALIAPKDLKSLLCRILLSSRLATVVDIVQNIKYLRLVIIQYIVCLRFQMNSVVSQLGP
jgi:hypothetical protein